MARPLCVPQVESSSSNAAKALGMQLFGAVEGSARLTNASLSFFSRNQAKGNTTQVAAIKAYREKIEAELAGSESSLGSSSRVRQFKTGPMS